LAAATKGALISANECQELWLCRHLGGALGRPTEKCKFHFVSFIAAEAQSNNVSYFLPSIPSLLQCHAIFDKPAKSGLGDLELEGGPVMSRVRYSHTQKYSSLVAKIVLYDLNMATH